MMENHAPDSTLALNWLAWWQYEFWLQADESWHHPRFAQLPEHSQSQFLHRHAAVWHQSLAIPPTPLSAPQPLILALTQLSPEARQQLLLLAAEICGCPTPLPAALKIWARRVAKATRPESWLPAGLFARGCATDSALLLQALWPAVWPRLKLLFSRSAVAHITEPPPALPLNRLHALWEATLWQIQRDSRERPNVEP